MNKINHSTSYYSGISGLQLPIPKQLYPLEFQQSSRLTYYASLFNSIEINSSFYKVPRENTVAKWATLVPSHFRFTFKLWKQITHIKELAFNEEDVKDFVKTISHTQQQGGCLLVQFPPSMKNENISQLESLLSLIKASDVESVWKIAIEFRNKSWYNDDVYGLLDYYNAAMVIHDKPASETPPINSSANFIYIRFHGPTGDYKGSYTEDFLHEYADYIKEWLEIKKTVYVYFNNTMGNAFNNLLTLNNFIALGNNCLKN